MCLYIVLATISILCHKNTAPVLNNVCNTLKFYAQQNLDNTSETIFLYLLQGGVYSDSLMVQVETRPEANVILLF